MVLALCVFEGKNYSLGDSWMDACLQCTCLHPIGVGCCETWVLTQLQCFYKAFLYTTDLPGCIGRWIFPRGARCGWSRLPAECLWSRRRTLVCPASPVIPSKTPARDRLGYNSSSSRGRVDPPTSLSLLNQGTVNGEIIHYTWNYMEIHWWFLERLLG